MNKNLPKSAAALADPGRLTIPRPFLSNLQFFTAGFDFGNKDRMYKQAFEIVDLLKQEYPLDQITGESPNNKYEPSLIHFCQKMNGNSRASELLALAKASSRF